MKQIAFSLLFFSCLLALAQSEPLWKRINKGHQALKAKTYDSAIYWYQQVWPEVRDEYQKAGGTSNFIAVSGRLFEAYLAKKDYTNASTYYYWELEAREKAYEKSDPKFFNQLEKGYRLFFDQGKYSRALMEINDLRSIQKTVFGEDSEESAISTFRVGECQLFLGDLDAASREFASAKSAITKIIGESHSVYLDILLYQAQIAERLAQYGEQKAFLDEGLANAKKHMGDSSLAVAKFQSELSGFYRSQGNYREAFKHLSASYKLWSALGKGQAGYVQCLEDIATFYLAAGQHSKGQKYIDHAVKQREKSFGKNHPTYARALKIQAIIQFKSGRTDQALQNFEKAKDIEKDQLGWQHPEVARSAYWLARIYHQRGYYSNARYWITDCLNIHQHQIDLNFPLMSDTEQQQYIAEMNVHLSFFYDFFLRWQEQYPELRSQVYNEILRSKGLLFRAQADMRTAVAQSGDAQIESLFDSLVMQRAYVSRLYESTPEALTKQGIDLLVENRRISQLDRRLRKASARYDYSKAFPNPTWEVVKRQLKPGEATVEVTRIQILKDNQPSDSSVYVAFIVTPDTQEKPDFVVIESGDVLENKAIDFYRRSVKYRLKDKQSYDYFWRPIAKKLSGIQSVYFAGDGIYHSISLNGLLNQQTNEYLFDEVNIHLLNSTREMGLPIPFFYPKKEESMILGYPEYNLADIPFHSHETRQLDLRKAQSLTDSTSLRFFNGKSIPMLPGTLEEIDALKKLFDEVGRPVEVYSGESATESNVKSWRSPRYAHIATHGFFLKDQDLQKEDELIAGVSKVAIADDPLLRSGLLLSHAKRAINEGGDGVLTAYEVMNLDLSSTQLVVLSACETGLGEIKNGEGVYGLTRAFQVAGAANVLMSLWTVSDEATQKLMTEFYYNYIVRRMRKRDAFRKAQEALRKEFPHPYYWAAFVMIGRS